MPTSKEDMEVGYANLESGAMDPMVVIYPGESMVEELAESFNPFIPCLWWTMILSSNTAIRHICSALKFGYVASSKSYSGCQSTSSAT